MKLALHNINAIWNKLSKGSVNRQIFGAALIVATGTAFVKLTSVLKELVVAWKFGTGDELDAFFIAFLVPSFIINVVAGSISAAFIPTYIEVREREGKKAAQILFLGVTILGLALLAIAAIIMVATAPLYLPLVARGFNSEKLELTFHLLYCIAPLIIVSGIIAIWSAVFNAGERFALAALLPMLTPISTILFVVGLKSWGAFSLVAGIIFGAVLEIIILGVRLYLQGVSLLPKFYKYDANMRQVIEQYLPTVAGNFLMCSSSIVDQSMAAVLSPGSVAALNYGNRLVALPVTLVTTALSTAVIPYFSKMVAHQDWLGVRRTLKYYMVLTFIVTLPITLLFIFGSEFIVSSLFQRGSFTSSDTHLVAQIQACFALQIPFYTSGILLVRLILAMKLNHILMWGSAYNLAINIACNYLFSKWIGVPGIALSTSCVYIFSFSFLSFHVIKKLKSIELKKNLDK